MIRIPGGTFVMGSDDGAEDQRPAHSVTLSPYWIDRTEVTIEAYARCVEAGACSVPTGSYCYWDRADAPDREHQPVNCVDWQQATTYCAFVGGRLPTEAEWEFAARGTDGRRFPWGNELPSSERIEMPPPMDDLDPCTDEGCPRILRERRNPNPPEPPDAPVAAYPLGASPFGVLDMAGSVWEWVADAYAPYSAGAVTDPREAAASEVGIARGCPNGGLAEWCDGRFRGSVTRSFRDSQYGFRCARDGSVQ